MVSRRAENAASGSARGEVGCPAARRRRQRCEPSPGTGRIEIVQPQQPRAGQQCDADPSMNHVAFPTDDTRCYFLRRCPSLCGSSWRPDSSCGSSAATSFLAVPLWAGVAFSAFGGGFHGFCPGTTRLSSHRQKRCCREPSFRHGLQVLVAGEVGVGDHDHRPALLGVADDDRPVVLPVRPGNPFLRAGSDALHRPAGVELDIPVVACLAERLLDEAQRFRLAGLLARRHRRGRDREIELGQQRGARPGTPRPRPCR